MFNTIVWCLAIFTALVMGLSLCCACTSLGEWLQEIKKRFEREQL